MSDPTIPPSDPTPTPIPPVTPTLNYAAPDTVLPPGYIEPDPQQRSLATLTYVLGITIWLGPLIMYLVKKDDPTTGPWLKEQMKKALNWGITFMIAYIICIPLNLVFCLGAILMLALLITNIVFVILNAMKANKGQAGSYPWFFPFVK